MIKYIVGFSLLSIAYWTIAQQRHPIKMNVHNKVIHDTTTVNKQIDYPGFLQLTVDLQDYRNERRIPMKQFFQFAKEENTIILDTRSKAAFEESHLKGAIHLNFSDFTEEKLAKVIPSKDTRILIYCNNNFDQGLKSTKQTQEKKLQSLALKAPPLALNIPTFINLYGYGYKNLYELESTLSIDHPQLIVDRGLIKKARIFKK